MTTKDAHEDEKRGGALKTLLDRNMVEALAGDIGRVYPRFDAAAFVASAIAGLGSLELTARAAHIAEALHAHLPRPFARAAEVLIASLGPELPPDVDGGMDTLRYFPHVVYVQKYGLDDFEPAMRLQYELTKRFTAEFSIRPFLVRYPDATHARLLEWTRDPDPHVRRLVSEGTRPRLPWAPRLRAYQADPSPVIALLEILRDDPSRYVQRSVANNLNDIAKDHPELVVGLCRRWREEGSPDREWIVRHALRTLVKCGHRGALEVLGAASKPRIRIAEVNITPRNARIGDRVRFSCTVISTSARAQELVIDYAVHFVRANGTTHAKVFKLRRVSLPARASVELAGAVRLEQLTTRRHYPGRHRMELIVNGVAYALGAFDLS